MVWLPEVKTFGDMFNRFDRILTFGKGTDGHLVPWNKIIFSFVSVLNGDLYVSVFAYTQESTRESKVTPLTTTTPLNSQSQNIVHVITFTISPHMRHLVKITPGVTSHHIAKVAT